MVMIIMVVLMVSFLITFQGFQNFLRRSPEKTVLGKTNFGDIVMGDRLRAGSDMRILGMMLGDARAPTGPEFLTLARMPAAGTDRDDAYAMLLQEADHSGVRVGEADIDGFLASIGLSETNYEAFLDQNLRPQGITETQFRLAIKDWLSIHKMFATSMILTPPSEREVSFLCRDLSERIDLRVLEFSADKYVDANIAVDPNQVQEQFNRFRTAQPGQFGEQNPFGFSYYQPDRIQVSYALLSRPVIERAIRVDYKEVDDYYTSTGNAGKFIRMTQPASAPGTAPAAGESNRLVPVRMTLEEARPRIVAELKAAKVAAKIAELSKKFTSLLAEVPASTPPNAAYQAAWTQLLRPREANAALDVSIDTTPLGSQKLEAAVAGLARLAGLNAIAFPWGEHGLQNISPDIVVKFEGKMTLRDALKQLCADAKGKEIDWGMCDGFDKVLFPLAGPGAADFFPILVRTTGLMDVDAYRKDDILTGTMSTPPLRASVGSLAFTAKVFNRPQQTGPAMKEGEDGVPMTVWQRGLGSMADSGTLLWRLLRAVPGKTPDVLTDDIRLQVEKDIRLARAYDVAFQKADKIRTPEQFAAADANGDANAVTTGPFPRRMMTREGGVQWATPPVLGLPPVDAIQKAFFDSAFALAPGASDAAGMGLLKVPSMRQVLVMKRLNFHPLTREEYVEQDRMQVLVMLYQGQNQVCRQVWFNPGAVQQRVGWKAENPGKARPADGQPQPAEPDDSF
jgi:hypothetical protein